MQGPNLEQKTTQEPRHNDPVSMLTALLEITEEIIQIGCSCDLMIGFQCNIHKYAREVSQIRNNLNIWKS